MMDTIFYWIGVVSTFLFSIVGAAIVIPWLIDQIKLDAEQVKTLWDFVRYKKEFKQWRKSKEHGVVPVDFSRFEGRSMFDKETE